jgi:hypothetical protein
LLRLDQIEGERPISQRAYGLNLRCKFRNLEQ